jgi:hypothetical protein
MPSANCFGGNFRFAKTESPQRLERLGIVGDAGEHQAAGVRVEAGSVLEQFGIMVFDAKQRLCQICFEGGIAGIAAEARKALEIFLIGRQTLRLLIGNHLQPMLETAQLNIGGGKILHRLPRDPALRLQLR